VTALPSAPPPAAVLFDAALPTAGGGRASTSGAGLARWRPWIAEASHRFNVPQTWILAVMRSESGGRLVMHGRPITSSAGAMGLMQLMPKTWLGLRARYRLGPDPYAPRDNILAGAAYLRDLYVRYGYPYLFAAYNAGPPRLDAHLFEGRPLPSETRAYLTALGQGGPDATSMRPPENGSLFPAPGSGASALNGFRSDALFVSLTTARPTSSP
jgi:soluble lytic murein transglycosylase-like protein